jgi:hypothetical protein
MEGATAKTSTAPEQTQTAHRPSCCCLDRRRERAKTASPVQGQEQTSPSRRW